MLNNVLSTILYALFIGLPFIIIFLFMYDFVYGEKREKQIRKLEKHYSNEEITQIEVLEHQPKNFTRFQIKLKKGSKKVTVRPGYKIVETDKEKKVNSKWF